MDGGPDPRSVQSRSMVIDVLRPYRADDAVINHKVNKKYDVRNPILVKRQKGKHNKKMKVKLDGATGEMNENRRGAQKSKADRHRRKCATRCEGGNACKEADDHGSCHRVKHHAVAKERFQAKFP